MKLLAQRRGCDVVLLQDIAANVNYSWRHR
jgi:hypothetical protein